ncbi:MAG: hypothetical protein H0X66_12280 [Verrucomicrobia bacterium]|nr:hypothetical protein [Verrucomicrobiota bacterium]
MNDVPPNPPRQTPWWIHFRWPIAIVFIFSLPLIGFIYFIKSGKDSIETSAQAVSKAVDQGLQKLGDVAQRFSQGTITETFLAAVPTLSRTPGGNLELATSMQTETFERSDMKTVAWDYLYLGTTIVEIKVPVTYRYHLQLSDPWRLDVSGNTCIVYAPQIRPSLPPAIHTDKMEKRASSGWARFNAQEQLDDLQKSITPTLEKYAGDRRHLKFVREECRKTVAEFVQHWLLREDQWQTNRFHTIKVIFPEEINFPIEDARPVVELRTD